MDEKDQIEEINNISGEKVVEKNKENKDSKQKDSKNEDNKVQNKDSGEVVQLNTEEEIENLYKEFIDKRHEVKEKIKEISEYLIVNGEELYYLEQEFTTKKERWIKNIYKRCCCCECDNCCKCCHCFCCCYKQKYKDYKKKINNKVEDMLEKEMKLEKIPIKLLNQNISDTSWIQNGKFKNFCFFISCKKLRYFCSLIFFYFLTIFHFIALSEVHGILLALFKEIERTLKRFIMNYYDFDKDDKKKDIIKTFYYYLTESNYHDSSQINFNYLSSLFTLFLIKKFNSYYNIVFVYLISIIFVTIFCSILLSYNYLTVNELKDNKPYNVWKLIFGFILPYVFIYTFAGFISLLPNKILDEIYSNEKLSGNLNKLIFINLCIGISVMIKNYINKFWIHLNFTSIYYILLFEIFIFTAYSSIYLFYLFLLLFITKKEKKERRNSFQINNSMSLLPVKESRERFYTYDINDSKYISNTKNITKSNKQSANNDNYSIFYFGGYFFIQTNSIYSFITIKGFGKYILSVFKNEKIWLILSINLCSRMQKLKFKTEYKKKIKNIHLLFFNFIFSVCFIIVLDIAYLIYIKVTNKKYKNQSIENFIMICLCLSFLYVFILSIIYYFIDSEPYSLYISIVITGSLNYLLNFYYSTQKAEYISLSGIISISQIIFRLIEFSFEPFDANNDYFWQISFSFVGLILSILYIILNNKIFN